MNLKNYQLRTLKILSDFLSNEKAFQKFQDAPGYNPDYQPLRNLEKVPYVCLQLPTGGRKTLIGTQAIQIAAENFIRREFPFVLWFVPSTEIRQQTLKVLRDPNNFYSRFLYEKFHGRVKIFDADDYSGLLSDGIQNKFINAEDFSEFARRILNRLINEKNFSLDELVRMRF